MQKAHTPQVAGRLLAMPELYVALFAFLLHLVWELWQVPLFREIGDQPHWRGIKTCTRAAGGDAAISLAAFWATAALTHSRRWIARSRPGAVAVFIAVGLIVTIVVEWLSTRVLERWAYGENMPVLPLLGTGLAPVAQWLLIPPLVVWLARRQLR